MRKVICWAERAGAYTTSQQQAAAADTVETDGRRRRGRLGLSKVPA